MKNTLFIAIICTLLVPVLFTNASYETVKNSMKEKCTGYSNYGSLQTGSNCSGMESSLYYIGESKVSKAVFENAKKEYDIKGPLCDKTQKSKEGELPLGITGSCKKGQFGDYRIHGKSVPYSEFFKTLLADTIDSSNSSHREQLLKDKKALKSLRSFTQALKSRDREKNIYSFSNEYPVQGGWCLGSGWSISRGTGYKDLVCEKNKVLSLEYYMSDKKVNARAFLSKIYVLEKKLNSEALKGNTK